MLPKHSPATRRNKDRSTRVSRTDEVVVRQRDGSSLVGVESRPVVQAAAGLREAKNGAVIWPMRSVDVCVVVMSVFNYVGLNTKGRGKVSGDVATPREHRAIMRSHERARPPSAPLVRARGRRGDQFNPSLASASWGGSGNLASATLPMKPMSFMPAGVV